MRKKEENYHRPIPFGRTVDAWFLRPNLIATGHRALSPAPTAFDKEMYEKALPDPKSLY